MQPCYLGVRQMFKLVIPPQVALASVNEESKISHYPTTKSTCFLNKTLNCAQWSLFLTIDTTALIAYARTYKMLRQ